MRKRDHNESDDRRVEELLAQLETTPPDDETLREMARAASAQPRTSREDVRRRRLPVRLAGAVGLALAVAVGIGIAIGASFAPSGAAASAPTGVGFLAQSGWTVHQSGSKATPEQPTVAIAANVPVHPGDVAPGGAAFTGFPSSTLATLPRRGVVIVASFTLRAAEPHADVMFPPRRLPLRLRDANPYFGFTLKAGRPLAEYRIRAGVNGHHVDVYVYFGTARPSQAAIRAAQRQLDRLVVRSPDGARAEAESDDAPRLPATSGTESADAARVVDRTLVCATGVSAGVRVLELGARAGVRERGASSWRWPAHAWLYNRSGIRYGIVGVAAPVSHHGSSPTDPVNGTSPPWPTRPDPGIGNLLTTLWTDAVRCRPTVARVPLAATGLQGGAADAFADQYDCAIPKRILVRVRAVFLTSTRLRLNRRFGFHTTNDVVQEGALAARTTGGKPLAYAEVRANGKARVFAAPSCTAR
jgi:hypothetical protein